MKKWNKLLLKILLVLIVIGIGIAGPTGYFLFKWVWANNKVQNVDQSVSSEFSTGSLTEAQNDKMLAHLFEVRNSVGLPSISAAIAKDGGIVWAGTVGYADIEKENLADIGSKYRIGSVSKPLSAVVLARLVDQGVIDLNTPISNYAPNLPKHLHDITPKMLASHTAGIQHYGNPSIWDYWPGWHASLSNEYYPTVEEGLNMFIEDELLFEPGTGFNYSTYGYSLLSYIMEKASSRSFDQLLSDELFKPMQMNSSAIDSKSNEEGKVTFYVTSNGKYTRAYEIDTSYKIAGGGIVSTPEDIVKFGQQVLGGSYLSDSLKAMMFQPVLLLNEEINPENYGIGWRIDTSVRLFGEDEPTILYSHGGIQVGGVSFFMLVPEYNISVAVLSNATDFNARSEVQNVSYELVRILTKKISE